MGVDISISVDGFVSGPDNRHEGPGDYEGRLSDDGDMLTGAWVFPGGGGYESTARMRT